MLCDKANAARLLDGLEQEGLVGRQRDPGDGRRWFVALTPEGEARRRAADTARRAAIRERRAGLQEPDKARLIGLLRPLTAGLDEHLHRAVSQPGADRQAT